jgi:hypothetical protein
VSGAAVEPVRVSDDALAQDAAQLTRRHAERFANGLYAGSGDFAHHSRVLRQTLARLGETA